MKYYNNNVNDKFLK